MTVLLFTWFCYTNENPGIIFVAMNYSVHAIMYVHMIVIMDDRSGSGRTELI